MLSSTVELKHLFGLRPSAQQLQTYIASLASRVDVADGQEPEIKSYSDAVYFNFYPLGCSMLFKPINGYTPSSNLQRKDLKDEGLILDSIDVYNPTQSKSKLTPSYSTYPQLPLVIKLDGKTTTNENDRSESMSVSSVTTGKDFVECIGEPDRKGGGVGPSTGGINIWLEWSKHGIMVELGGDDARGPQAWDKGRDAQWKVITLYNSQDNSLERGT